MASLTAIHELAWFACVATCIKLLLIPSYLSTDFEVHRHWLALTSSLPLSLWYSDQTSQWTLDYPPFFAYFEKLLSFFANLIDPQITNLHHLNYTAPSVIYFQRSTVIISDCVLFYGVWRLTRNFKLEKRRIAFALILWSPSLFIVDHIHFQYNGFLLGILLLSLSFLEDGRDVMGGFLFAVLLCFKHLFAVAAPLYFVYLLRHYCMCEGKFLRRFLLMGVTVGAVFALAFGPFWYHGQMQQVLHRLFPFGRGLCHAYWAPNFWVFYIILDKGLAFLLKKLGFHIQMPAASFTGGLVGASPFAVLPQVTPAVTLLLVLLAIFPCLLMVWRRPQAKHVTRWVAYAYTCGFLFGWHVHEKASLHFVIPLGILAVNSFEDFRHYFLLSIVSCYSLFPLLFEAKEYPIKVLLLAIHSTIMWSSFSAEFEEHEEAPCDGEKRQISASAQKRGLVGWVGLTYLLGLLVVEIWGQLLHPYIFGDKLPFLPLMLVSIYCSLGMIYSCILQLNLIIRCP